MKRPIESDYTSQVAYTRALEAYCDSLAQPAQEPVAKVLLTETLGLPVMQWLDLNRQFDFKGGEYLYTAPQQRPWVGLTDEELTLCESEEDVRFVRAIEAVLRSKNT